MAEIALSNGGAAIVDDCDGDLAATRWHRDRGYARHDRWEGDRKLRILMHRVILERMFGALPPDMECDHRNGDRLDNRRANLRLVTRRQNSRNAAKRSPERASSKYIGVYWHEQKGHGRGTWVAQITTDKKHRHLGTFERENDAARAYDAAARELFGAYARLNFPE